MIFGYTKGEGSREKTFGSLILGLYGASGPAFIGKVGTGLSEDELEDLKYLLDKYRVEKETLVGVDMEREVTWLRPDLVCEVGYHSITGEGMLRIPVFKRLREDRNPLSAPSTRYYLEENEFKEPLQRKFSYPACTKSGSHCSRKMPQEASRRLVRPTVQPCKNYPVPEGSCSCAGCASSG